MPGPLQGKHPSLPPIPSKHYFTIGEVSSLCQVKPHVLRYWEQEFDQLKSVKRRGNRRYYQPHEVQLVRDIRGLLYDQGFTISGARAILESKTPRHKLSDAPWKDPVPIAFSEPEAHQGQSGWSASHSYPSASSELLANPENPHRDAQHAMANLMGGTAVLSSQSAQLDLPALKRELRSIIALLETD